MQKQDRNPKAVFITGAGLSADSGIRTFRGEGGLYQGMRAEQVMSARTMRHNPELIHRFCDDRRVELAHVEPNAAHEMIVRLAVDFGSNIIHLTQNVDDLAERAGHMGTVHLHGFMTRMRSVGNSKVTEDIGYARYWDGDQSDAPEKGFRFRCPKTNSYFRPDVVLFEELAPEYRKLWKALKELRRDDILVVIGTQGSVLPVEQMARQSPCLTVLNNLHQSEDINPDAFDVVMMERAAEAASEIESLVRSRLGHATAPKATS